ncbi:type II toxin-antitoxin system RelE family toxin [Candidatus Tisiphia endosymbiont of Dioctria rufipes]|uniref:type II toxin-antitoxin system RelE family toxin n=1 Tax=unclassified Candidatus Tisiphia TaxID=2996318 RepID=UPI003977ADF9
MSVKYNIELAPLAQRQLKKLPRQLQKDIIKNLENLNPKIPNLGIKKLSGMDDLYRLRVGDYRVIYKIQHNILLILVLKIGHRKDIYNNLNSLINKLI